MEDTSSLREAARWQEMKLLRAQGLDFWEWVEPLHALGLLECRNCKAGIPNTRVTSKDTEVCRTCEGTVTQFWRRNLRRLAADEAVILEVKGEWIEAHRQLERSAWRNLITTAEVTTERTVIETRTENVDGNDVTRDVPVTTRTVRRERKYNLGVARFISEVQTKLATMGGLDVTTPESANPPPPRGKQHVHRLEPGEEPLTN